MQLQTITENYAQLNRDLHALDETYGSGSWRHAEKVIEFRADFDAETVLDYGAGKGSLKTALGDPEWFREYDPAIPGKDARPVMADIVICTDVLEHIEPDLLNNVLTDIVRLTGKVAFLVIATQPAIKSLPDGSNTHKIVENAAWWEAKLAEKFFILSSESDGRHVTMLVSPVRPVKGISGKSAVSNTIRSENAFRNCSVVKERALSNDLLPRHDNRICIVGFGPSLRDTWRDLLVERRAFGAKIVSTSGAHDFLIERGIVPDYHVEVDPREHKAFFTRNSHPTVNYWIASCCHPKLVDNLVDRKSKVALWHLLNSDDDLQIAAPDGPDPDAMLVCGGSGVAARAIHLFYTQGYRSFSLYGMDCSFDPKSREQHAGEHTGKIQSEWNVRVGERWFLSSAALVYMARSVIDSFRMLDRLSKESNEPFIIGTKEHLEFLIHGDGLLPEMVAESNRIGTPA